MAKGSKQIRKLLAELDQVGLTININRVCAKRYELQINFENIRTFRQRKSCNKRIQKLYTKHFSPKN